MIIVVPMAGRGSRFFDAQHLNPEYANPKPLIAILGKPMVCWAIESLPFIDLPKRPASTELKVPTSKLVFICRRDHEDEFAISSKLKEVFAEDITVLFVDQITRGAAETVLIAKDLINTDEEIIISDSDHYFDGTNLYEAIRSKNSETVGIIPVFQPPDNEPKWSYTLFDENRVASAVGEKDAELAAKGAWANIGGYYFSKGKIYVEEAEEMIANGDMYGAEGKKEFYLAPVYDRLIKKGHRVEVALIPQVWGLGTPKDVEYFENNFKQ
ncbi:MAG: hypothetical protein HYU80_02145 [Candidatus Blackburnbacteria bacterium]|nr:hypothetical protein [Candidatus Blackburnbacteria bacterium]